MELIASESSALFILSVQTKMQTVHPQRVLRSDLLYFNSPLGRQFMKRRETEGNGGLRLLL